MPNSEERRIKQGSALIADVVNFYGQELRSLEEVGMVLDDLYSSIMEAVLPHRGQIVKWLGDGALVCFWDEDHALNAVKSAVELQKAFQGFAKRHTFEHSGLTVSVATGEMIVGPFGVGEAAHYDVFGEPINCTATTVPPKASGLITMCSATVKALGDAAETQRILTHQYYGSIHKLIRLKA